MSIYYNRNNLSPITSNNNKFKRLINKSITNVLSVDMMGVEKVEDYAFYNCSDLSNVNLLDCNNIGNYAFYNCGSLINLSGLATKVAIGGNAFNGCTGFTGYDFSNINVSSLGDAAFYRAGSLREDPTNNPLNYNFYNSTFEIIYNNVFGGTSTSKISNITITFPKSLLSVGALALSYLDNSKIYFNSLVAPTIQSTTFNGSTNYKIYASWGGLNSYLTKSNWTTLTSNIVGYMRPGELNVGDSFPTINGEGYELNWFSDEYLTIPVTTVTDSNAIYYCSLGTQSTDTYYSYSNLNTTYCNVALVDTNNKNYIVGEGILENTSLTVTATPTIVGYVPFIITVNGVEILNGDTITVTSNIQIVAIYYNGITYPVDPVLNNNSWAVIKHMFDIGEALNYWSLGDTKQVTLTDNHTYNMQLVDATSGRYTLTSGGSTNKAVFLSVECLATTYQMNATNTNVGGFADSALRNTLNTTIWNRLSSDLLSVIAEVEVASGTGGGSTSGVSYSSNKLFLPCAWEIFGSTSYSIGLAEGSPQYGYWILHNTSAERIKYRVNAPTTAQWYWLRSPYSGHSTHFVGVYGGGGASGPDAAASGGVSFCFAI